MAVRPTVLLYNFTDKKRRTKVNTFCAMNGIRVKTVEKEQYGEPLIALVDSEAKDLFPQEMVSPCPDEEGQRGESEKFSGEMLVMCQVGGKMNGLLSWLRKEKVSVPLKAALTQTNQFWTSSQLYREIKKEHEQMTGREL